MKYYIYGISALISLFGLFIIYDATSSGGFGAIGGVALGSNLILFSVIFVIFYFLRTSKIAKDEIAKKIFFYILIFIIIISFYVVFDQIFLKQVPLGLLFR